MDPLDPDEALPYQVTFEEECTAMSAVIVAGAIAISVSPSGLSVGDGATTFESEAGDVTPAAPTRANSNRDVQLWLYGGAEGTTYTVEVTVRLDNGAVVSRSMKVPVVSR